MAYPSFAVDQFGGLNLREDPGDLGWRAAVDIKNVVVESPSKLRVRPGTSSFISQRAAGEAPAQIIPWQNGQTLVNWVHDTNKTSCVAAYDSAGSAVASGASNVAKHSTATPFVAVSGPSSYVMIADWSRTAAVGTFQALRYWDGSAWSTSAAVVPENGPLWLTSWQGRLVAANMSDKPWNVWFSNAGDPFTFGTNNFVGLDPGDGVNAGIAAVVTWDNDLYVFKRSRFYRFYGVSVDSSGNPVFNYNTVNAGPGAVGSYEWVVNSGTGNHYGMQPMACAARDGVYFIGDNGVYRTTGGRPEKISGALDPWFAGESTSASAAPSYTGAFEFGGIWAAGDYVYVAPESAAATFVYDIVRQYWTIYDFRSRCGSALSINTSSTPRWLAMRDNTVVKMGREYTTDAGSTAIASHYQSGFAPVADGAQARVGRFQLSGSGTVSHAYATDYGSVGSTSSVTLGFPGYDTRTTFGRYLSWKVSASSGAWTLDRWQGLLMGGRSLR